MKTILKRLSIVVSLALAVACMGAPDANATNFSFTGNFNQDDNVQLFNFSLSNASTVDIRTWSYDGGTNAAGAAITAGGFDPTLTLFDSTGVFIEQSQDISPTAFDAFISGVSLLAGNYIVALTEYDNFPNATDTNNLLLSNGFTQQGQGNFTGPEFLGAPGSFINVDGLQRTSQWAVDILGVDTAGTPAPVPEPATLLLLAAGLGGLGILRMRSRKQLLSNI